MLWLTMQGCFFCLADDIIFSFYGAHTQPEAVPIPWRRFVR